MESPKKKQRITKVFHDLNEFIAYAKNFKSFKFTVQSYEDNIVKGSFQLCPDFALTSTLTQPQLNQSQLNQSQLNQTEKISDRLLNNFNEHSMPIQLPIIEEDIDTNIQYNETLPPSEGNEDSTESTDGLGMNLINDTNIGSDMNLTNLIPISYSLARKIKMENFLISNEFEQFCNLLKIATPCKNNQFPEAFDFYNKKLAPLINQEKLNCSLISSIIKSKTGVELSSKRLNIWRKNSPKKTSS